MIYVPQWQTCIPVPEQSADAAIVSLLTGSKFCDVYSSKISITLV